MKTRIVKRVLVSLILATFLTVSTVGEVEHVSATVTGAAIASAAALGAGIIFLSYLAFTGARVEVPSGAEQTAYLTRIGERFSQSSSGSAVFNDIKSFLMKSSTPMLALPEYVFNWTSDIAQGIYNEFKSIDLLQDIFGWDKPLPTDGAQNGYDYGTFTNVPQNYQGGDIPSGWDVNWNTGARILWNTYANVTYAVNMQNQSGRMYRSLKNAQGLYKAQWSSDGVDWYDFTSDVNIAVIVTNAQGAVLRALAPSLFFNGEDYVMTFDSISGYSYPVSISGYREKPVLVDAMVVDAVTGEEEIPVAPPIGAVEHVIPQWYDIVDTIPDSAIVPYVELPSNNPNNYNPDDENKPWGLPLGLILEALERLSEGMIDIGVIGEIINTFKNGLSGDTTNEYNYYSDEGDTYNYYYSNTYYQNEYTYNYNYNITEESQNLPVNLNTLKQVTDNRMFYEIQKGTEKFGDTMSNYVAFWHNSDYTIVYITLGGILWICLCAFIGKWGGH